MNPDVDPRAAWSEYWRSGNRTTFLDGAYNDRYDGELAQFWEQVADDLPDTARVADLGTGNGVVALAIAHHCLQSGKNVRVTGIDHAVIDPDRLFEPEEKVLIDQGTLEFQGETGFEHLPFADGELDAVVSCFGFEYGDIEQVVAEADRVLNQHGLLAAVIHHADSEVVRRAQRSAEAIDFALHQARLPLMAGRMLDLTGTIRDPARLRGDREAEKRRQALNSALAAALARGRELGDEAVVEQMCQQVMMVFGPARNEPLESRRAHLRHVLESQRAFAERMNQLARAARSDDELAAIESLFRQRGFNVQPSRRIMSTATPPEVMGVTLVAKR